MAQADYPLCLGCQVLPPLEARTLPRSKLSRLVVCNPREGEGELLQASPQDPELLLSPLQDSPYDEGEQPFEQHHVLGLLGERLLCLDHPELREVLCGPRLLSPEGGLEDPDFLQRGQRGFLVELGGLTQVGLLPEVVDFEEGGAALDGGLDKGGGTDQDEPLLPEVVEARSNDLGAYLHRRDRLSSPDAQVTLVVEKGGRLRSGFRYRPGLGERYDSEIFHLDLTSPRRPPVLSHHPLCRHGRLPRRRLHRREGGIRGHASLCRELNVAAPIPEEQKDHTPDCTLTDDPSVELRVSLGLRAHYFSCVTRSIHPRPDTSGESARFLILKICPIPSQGLN